MKATQRKLNRKTTAAPTGEPLIKTVPTEEQLREGNRHLCAELLDSAAGHLNAEDRLAMARDFAQWARELKASAAAMQGRPIEKPAAPAVLALLDVESLEQLAGRSVSDLARLALSAERCADLCRRAAALKSGELGPEARN